MKFMSMKFLALSALFLSVVSFAQVGNINMEQFTAQGTTGAIFAQMRQVKDIKSDLPTVGSVYIHDDFKACKIYYKEEFVGDFYYRHNSYNDEIEIKDTPSANDKDVSSLVAMRQLRLIDTADQSEVALHVYNSKEGTLRNGYLYELSQGPKYSLYFKNNVKYRQGTHPVNSMTRPTPNKFSHFVEYYLKRNGEETAEFIGKNKSEFLRTIDPNIRENIKDYMKEEKINFNEEPDLLKLFGYMNTLAGADSQP